MDENKICNTSTNIVYLLKKHFLSLCVIIFILYLLPFYQLLLHTLIFMLFITIFPEYIHNIKSLIIDFIYDTFTDYLGNCSFDPLPRTKN